MRFSNANADGSRHLTAARLAGTVNQKINQLAQRLKGLRVLLNGCYVLVVP